MTPHRPDRMDAPAEPAPALDVDPEVICTHGRAVRHWRFSIDTARHDRMIEWCPDCERDILAHLQRYRPRGVTIPVETW